MRLRNRVIPQAGTGALRDGESRPGPSGSGCPSYSGEGNESHQSGQSITVAESLNHLSPVSSTKSSLFPSAPSSPQSYLDLRSIRSSISSCSLSSVRTGDVVQEAAIAENIAPTRSTRRTRKTWTKEINTFIMRQYLIITELESKKKAYLTQLHSSFTSKYPEMEASKQRIGDQRRAIINCNLLSVQELTQIREEVRNIILNPQTNIETNTGTRFTQTQQRLSWSDELNEYILKSYYRLTQLETNRTSYRKPLHEAFTNKFPALAHLTEQRISDQLRAIINNKYITDERLNTLREEVADELIVTNLDRLSTNTAEIQDTNTYNLNNREDLEPDYEQETTEDMHLPKRDNTIDETFKTALENFINTDPTSRVYIPKQKTSRNLACTVNYLNKITLPDYINEDIDFNYFQTLIYCAAWTAAKINGTRLSFHNTSNSNPSKSNRKPQWQIRLEKRIEDLRVKIGRMTQFIKGGRSRNLIRHVNKIIELYKIHAIHEEPNTQTIQILDTLKQKLSILTGRLRRYNTCTLRKQQNIQFYNNEKQFYRNIRIATANTVQNENNTHTDLPDPNNLQNFWAGIWEKSVNHNYHAEWIENEKASYNNVANMSFEKIPINTFQQVIHKLHNWKAPGSDFIHNYWYKKFTSIHNYLHNYLNQFIEDPSKIPAYITSGTTFMIPKDYNDPTNPAKYRPITCLQTVYKILTSCLTELIYEHINKNSILAEQQKGCRKFSQGCKEQLIIDSVILKHVNKTKDDLYSMYIDYKKAYDSVPHSWLLEILEIYKIHPKIINMLKTVMTSWQTKLKLKTPTNQIETPPIQIQRGIFQGDALSPLWFCLALNPLSNILNSTDAGYRLHFNDTHRQTETINHLLYMDDIKLYADSEADLYRLIELTELFTNDIKMNFGVDKTRINSIKTGRTFQHTYTLQSGECIEPLDEGETYKYLGYNQSMQIQYKDTKLKLKQKFQHRLNAIMKSKLYARNTIKAINTFAIPILTYSFGIINWNKSELITIQRKINTTMTKFRKHHPRSCVQRLTLPRKEGGRGIIDVTNLHNKQILNLRQYFFAKSEASMLHKVIVHNDNKFTPLNLLDSLDNRHKVTDDRTKLSEWAKKALHGRHLHDLCQTNVDKEASNAWLSRGDLFPETEGFMVAIQDQTIETRNYQRYITKTLTSDSCRKCHSCPETIQHITGACKTIVQTDYKHRHDQVASIIHQRLAKQRNFITDIEPYYKYKPQNVLDNSSTKLYFDRTILTDRTTHYNRPDITLVDKINKTAYLIDIAVPNTHNIQSTIAEKLTKYIELKDEISRLWHLEKVTIVPIVLSTTGVIPKQLHKSLHTLQLPSNLVYLLQKAVILNTCRIVRKFLQTDDEAPTLHIPQTHLHTIVQTDHTIHHASTDTSHLHTNI